MSRGQTCSKRAEGKRERLLGSLLTQNGHWCEAWFHNPQMMAWAEIRSWMLNWARRHPRMLLKYDKNGFCRQVLLWNVNYAYTHTHTHISYFEILNIWMFNWNIVLVSSYVCLNGSGFIWFIYMDLKMCVLYISVISVLEMNNDK